MVLQILVSSKVRYCQSLAHCAILLMDSARAEYAECTYLYYIFVASKRDRKSGLIGKIYCGTCLCKLPVI